MCDKDTWATHTLDSHHRLRATQRHATGLHSGYTCFWLVQVYVVGGTDQGVAQLQQEFSPDFETQIPPVLLLLGKQGAHDTVILANVL